jgi:glycosyltransferase involved in cell wall biosynthesis
VRVAHVNDIAYVASELARAQRKRGLDVVVLDPGKPAGSLPYPLKAISWPLRVPSLAVLAIRLRGGHFDVVHVHYATHGVAGLTSGVPFILHCHGSDIRDVRPESHSGRYLNRMMRRASDVLYSTPDLRGPARALRSDARFMPNPIDVDRFSPDPMPAPDRDVLLGVRLHPIKGAPTAIDAVAELRRRRPGTTVTLLDDGPLAAQASERLGDDVLVVPRQAHEAMPALLRRHRVTLGQYRLGILSQYELEAMACGVPVVADFRYPEAYATPPPVLAATSVAEAADALERVLEDPALLVREATRSRRWVIAEHAAARVAGHVSEVYAGAIGRRRDERPSDRAQTQENARLR